MKNFLRLAAWLSLAALGFAQNTLDPRAISQTASGSITSAGTGSDCSVGASCVWIVAPATAGAASVQLGGTFTAAVQFESSVDGSSWSAAAASSSGQTNASAPGIYSFNLLGANFLRVRASSFSSGPVMVAISTGAALQPASSSDFRTSGMAKLPTWKTKLSNVSNASGDARVLFVGDSTTWGAYSANYPSNPTSSAWPDLMSKLLPSVYPVSNASINPQASGTSDSRASLTGGTAQINTLAGFAHECYTMPSAGTLVFTPSDSASYDSFTVYTQGGGGGGTISAQATGGTSSNIVQPYSNTVQVTTVTAGSAGTSNAVTLTWVSGTVQVIGIEASLSTTHRIRFANVGFSGSTTAVWADNLTSQTAIKAWAPDLTVIMLGINDAQASVSLTTYLANLQAIITAAKVSGDVVILSMVPSSTSGTGSTFSFEQSYAGALSALAAANNAPFIDLFNRFGGAWVSPLMTNTLHPNPAGYADMARFVYSYLFN